MLKYILIYKPFYFIIDIYVQVEQNNTIKQKNIISCLKNI